MFRPKFERKFTVRCCDLTASFDWEHDALDSLLEHIEQYHPDKYRSFLKKARLAARCQNGCGYWDSNNENGWDKAQETFRRAWLRTVFGESLGLSL